MISDAIGGFVSGSAPWHTLTKFGIAVEMSGPAAIVSFDSEVPNYRPNASDVARGFARRIEAGDVQEWAQVLLAAAFVDLSLLESAPHGQDLLEAIWDAAQGIRPDRTVRRLLAELTAPSST
jgi:hypothetical protein